MEPCPASGADACEGGAVEGGADGGKTGVGGDAGIGAFGLLESCLCDAKSWSMSRSCVCASVTSNSGGGGGGA